MRRNKIRIIHTISRMAAIAVMAFVCGACGYEHHKEIVCGEDVMRTITVLFNWENAPEASPEGMTLYFFPTKSSGRIWRFDIAGPKGGEVEIPSGSYRLLAFNNDARPVNFTFTSAFDTFSATTSAAAGSTAELPTIKMPEPLYAGTVNDLEITLCGVRYTPYNATTVKECGKSLVRCSPSPRTCKYNVIVEDIENFDRVTGATAAVTGMAESVTLASDMLKEPSVAIPFKMSATGNNTLEGKLLTFGALDSSAQTLLITATLADGTTIRASHDVSDQILNSPDRRNVTIIVKGLKIPPPEKPDDPVGGDGNLDVDVAGWTVIEIDLSSDKIY